MKRIFIVSALAIACSGCAAPLAIGALATAALVQQFDPSLGVGPKIEQANAVIVNAVGPYAKKAVNEFFCNKYAQRAFDPSEAKNQPKVCGI